MRPRRSSQIVNLANTPGLRPFDPGTFARLCRARDYLAVHYARPVFLAEAAQQDCLSPFYFNRLLPRPSARRRMSSSPAGASRYESLGSFSTRFHSLTGLSPAAFRGEARRTFGGFGVRWPLYYIPGCFQRAFLPES